MEKFEQLSEEKKQLIINAAMEEFTLKGFLDASTNVITRKAGISKGALFHYFGSKQRLYDYLLKFVVDRMRLELLDNFPEEKDLIELFIKVGAKKAQMAKTHPTIFEFLYRAYKDDPEGMLYQEVMKDALAEFQSLIYRSIDTSRFRPGIEPATAIDMCTWVSEGVGKRYAEQHADMDADLMMKEGKKALDALRIMLYKE